jgi:hypothetical protein
MVAALGVTVGVLGAPVELGEPPPQPALTAAISHRSAGATGACIVRRQVVLRCDIESDYLELPALRIAA